MAWEDAINDLLLEFKVIKEPFQENAAEELESVLVDYNAMAQQYGEALVKFCQEAKPVYKSQMWFCPDCGKRIHHNHSHCHWCGKKIGWK